jgi:hypothetical protein
LRPEARIIGRSIREGIWRAQNDQAQSAKGFQKGSSGFEDDRRNTRAAEFAADMAAWQAVFSVAGIAFVGATVVFTYLATRGANDALRIAVEADRAHVLSDSLKLGNFFECDRSPCVAFRIVNHGQSPCWVDGIGIMVFAGSVLPKDPPNVPMLTERLFVLPPAGFEPFMEPFDKAVFKAWQSKGGTEPVFAVGRICYRDVFGIRRESCFAYRFLYGATDMTEGDVMVPWGGREYWRYT